MLEELKDARHRVVGTRQVLRAVKAGQALRVFVCKDAETFVYRRVYDAAEAARVPVTVVEDMAQLGKACRVDVKAAAAALVREPLHP